MKISIFDRLTGGPVDAFDSFDEELSDAPTSRGLRERLGDTARPAPLEDDTVEAEGQLPVDVHQTAGEIVIRAFVAGVRPDELNISIGRDLVEIEGSRSERTQVSGPDYFTRELFWGSFSRTITLPEEVDVDESTASAKDGLLTLVLPKLDKKRQTKLKVKAG
ncbi:MAG: Hsp20/alpha crystallin family protein [Candidatus Paceibacterota bacterium]